MKTPPSAPLDDDPGLHGMPPSVVTEPYVEFPSHLIVPVVEGDNLLCPKCRLGLPAMGRHSCPQPAKKRKIGLTTLQLHLLDAACKPLNDAFEYGAAYLVGTAQTGGEYRDVDVRLILSDKAFDRLFAGQEALWSILCSSIGWRLAVQTSLPIDFQIQRKTEANAKYDGPRNPLGRSRVYAGGGDATRFCRDRSQEQPVTTYAPVADANANLRTSDGSR